MYKKKEVYTYVDKVSGKNYPLPLEPVGHEPSIIRNSNQTIKRLGYLVHDPFPGCPLDDYGEWELGTSNRRDGKRFNDVYRRALGLDDHWRPVLEASDLPNMKMLFSAWVKENQPLVPVIVPTTLMADYTNFTKEQLGYRCIQTSSLTHMLLKESELRELDFQEMLHDFFDGTLQFLGQFDYDCDELDSLVEEFVGELPDVEQVKQALRLIDELEDRVVNPDKIMLSVYEHGVRIYSLLGEGVSCRWDTAHGGAVLVPSPSLVEEAREHSELLTSIKGGVADPSDYDDRMIDLAHELADGDGLVSKRAVLLKWAESQLESYNAYINGDVYGVVIVDYVDGGEVIDSDDCCHGYYGLDQATEGLAYMMNSLQSEE